MQNKKLGPYRIGKQIGKGGMGAVYEAADETAGERHGMRVAVKVLTPQLAAAEGFRERFEAEIESLKKLRHAGIVRLYGYGEQEGILFYSMELVDGTSLEEELNAGRRFDWLETIRFGIQISQALKHAHDHGIVHRDIKPANLLLTSTDQIKIADFGIARLFGSTQLTNAGGVLGTADYMSPEQADGQSVTEKCDQYSLGGVMYALLAGRPPFKATTMPEMLQLQRFAEPEPVRRYAPDTPAQLEQLVKQLLAKDPAERFPNALVLGRHMEAMEKALTRPVKEQESVETKVGEPPPNVAPDATTDFSEEATRALDSPAVIPHDAETDQARLDLYDAPTLDVPDRSESEPTFLPKTSGIDPKPTSKPTSKQTFTTVDEAARREREQARVSPASIAVQLVGLAAVLGFLVWGGWQLMQPATADELYQKITTTIDEQGSEGLRFVSGELDDFHARFPDDPRNAEFEQFRQQLMFQKFERKARRRSKSGGSGGTNPLESVYFSALSMAESDPARGLETLKSLLDLYDPTDQSSVELQQQETGTVEDINQLWLVLARQQIKELTVRVQQQSDSQLPILKNRLSIAAKLLRSQPERAIRMYQAIVDLYGNQPWAQEIVEQAAMVLSEEASQFSAQDPEPEKNREPVE